MGQIRACLVICASFFLALALCVPAHSEPVIFFVDVTGGATGLTPIPNTPDNIGNYAAGSWLTLSGNVAATINGETYSADFLPQSPVIGSFPDGFASSLDSFYDGQLFGGVDSSGFSLLYGQFTASAFNGHYPQVLGSAIRLWPAIGGGTSPSTSGSDLANYGAGFRVDTPEHAVLAAGHAAVRNFGLSVQQIVGGPGALPLTGPLGQSFVTNGNFEVQVFGNFDYNLARSGISGNTMPDTIGSIPLGDFLRTPTIGADGTISKILNPDGSRYYMLTLPITTTFVRTIPGDIPLTVTFTLSGQIAAMGMQAPEPSTIALVGSAALPAAFFAWRRRR